MRRKDREVTDFDTIVGIIDECDILRLGLADGDYPYIVPVNFAYTVERTAVAKLTVTEMSAKVNPVRGGADA